MVQRSCTKTNNDVQKQGGGDDEQSPYLKIPHTSKERRKRNASGKVLRFWLITLSRGLPPKSLRLLPFLLQQLQTSLPEKNLQQPGKSPSSWPPRSSNRLQLFADSLDTCRPLVGHQKHHSGAQQPTMHGHVAL